MCHGAWTPSPLSAHLSIECRCTVPQIETPICTCSITTHQFFWQQQRTCCGLGGSLMECGMGGQPHKTPHFHSRHHYPPSQNYPSKKSLGLAQLPLHWCQVFPLCLYKWGIASSAACECGAEEQTVDHVLQCPIHWPPHGLHGLMVLDDETTEWLLATAPKSSAAKQWAEELTQKKKKLNEGELLTVVTTKKKQKNSARKLKDGEQWKGRRNYKTEDQVKEVEISKIMYSINHCQKWKFWGVSCHISIKVEVFHFIYQYQYFIQIQ